METRTYGNARLVDDCGRHLAAVLLDLGAAYAHLDRTQAKYDRAAPPDQDRISDELAALDDQIDQLKTQAKRAIERDTGVTYERITEANL